METKSLMRIKLKESEGEGMEGGRMMEVLKCLLLSLIHFRELEEK
jgi:hypothetical protein